MTASLQLGVGRQTDRQPNSQATEPDSQGKTHQKLACSMSDSQEEKQLQRYAERQYQETLLPHLCTGLLPGTLIPTVVGCSFL